MSRYSKRNVALNPKRRLLLDVLLQEEGLGSSSLLRISRRNGLCPAPLSFAQQRLWFLDQLEPGNPFYNIKTGVRMKGALNSEALQKALDVIVARHEILRTTFPAADGIPFQCIAPTLSVTLRLVDLSQLPATEREREVIKLIATEARQPFNLSQGPLLRNTLLRLGESEHVLLVTMHHIVSDGWSMNIFRRELTDLYNAFSTGKPCTLADLPIQYADFAQWQREWLQGQALESQFSYWKQQLSGAPALLELPLDRPRPAIQSFCSATQPIVLSKNLAAKLKALGRQEGATLFMTLLAAFEVLLYRYTGRDHIVVGSPHAGRNHVETESLMGFFVNMLILRTDLSGDPSFRELLGRVREVALSAYAHPDLPFERLIEELKIERSLSYNPLFQVMFVLQNTPDFFLNLSGLTMSPMNIDGGTAKFDLILDLTEREEGIKGGINYSTDLFDQATISRMATHFCILLEGVAAHPERRLSTLPLLTQGEQIQLLVDWYDTRKPYPLDECVHHLFEVQAERAPDSVAVILEGQQFTYRELNQRANQLGHYLRRLGVGPEVIVGLCVERSVEMVVGLLGILKAGGAYLPLDPVYPAKRLALMLRNGRVRVLLTQQNLLGKLLQPADLSIDVAAGGIQTAVGSHSLTSPDLIVVRLDSDWEAIGKESHQDPIHQADSNNLAYVIFTSGSTGSPKAAMIQHGSLSNYTLMASSEYAIQPGDRVLQFASIGFDASVEEIYPCLTRGATLVLRTDAMLESVAVFFKHCRDREITVLSLPTSYWHEVVAEIGRENLQIPSCLRLIILGGEEMLPGRLAAWQKHSPHLPRLLNTYGPTESTVIATLCELSAIPQRENNVPVAPIGRPVDNVQAYVLDRFLHPVPIGVPGELCLGGLGLARGYLNEPELTAEKFIPNPFGEEHGARMYRTGDLVRQRTNGDLDFVGRTDLQVKIRGFRIELAEIETVLQEHRGVRQAVAVVRQDGSEEKQLIGYVVPVSNGSLKMDELTEHLRLRLPHYMLPSALVMLEVMPLTPSGKIDRRELPLPGQTLDRTRKNIVAPRTPVEENIANIWAQVLGLDQISVHDNFFDLGGHSLLATKVISRIRLFLQTEVSLRSLFENPTVAGLAAGIEKSKSGSTNTASQAVVQLLAELEERSDEEASRILLSETNQDRDRQQE